ncbi:MAG: copper chaperone PCu(A)C [Oceanicoccus sp.]
MLRSKTAGLIVSIFAVLLSAMSSAELRIEEGFVRGLPPGQQTTAAFMRLVNDGDSDVTIVGASTDSAERAEIHAHTHRNGMMSMQRVVSIVVPAQSTFVLKSGEYHLMLINLHRPLNESDTVFVELLSAAGNKVNATLPVRSVLNEHKHH